MSAKITRLQEEIVAKHPKLSLECSLQPRNTEYYAIEKKGELVRVKASDAPSLIFGLSKLNVPSDLPLNCLNEARFVCRILAPSQTIIQDELVPLIEMAQEFGFNGVLMPIGANEGIEYVRSMGIRVILDCRPVSIKMAHFPFDAKCREEIRQWIESLPQCDGILWQSPFFNEAEADLKQKMLKNAKLRMELFCEELKILEAELGIQEPWMLFYAFPFKPSDAYQFVSSHFTEIQKHGGPLTYFVFPAVDGDPGCSFLAPHPILLQSSGRLLCYIACCVEKGPLVAFSDVESFFTSAGSNALAGAYVAIDRLPEGGEFASANLLMIAESLWSGQTPINIFDNWIRRHHPKYNLPHYREWIKALGRLVHPIRRLQAVASGVLPATGEELRLIADSFIAELKWFEHRLEQDKKKGQDAHFCGEVSQLLSHAKKVVRETLKGEKLPVPVYLNSDL